MKKTKLKKHNHNNTTSQHIINNHNSSHSPFTAEDDMTNLGYYNFTSSSSSSNLSPLAQPFTVDRSNPNPNLNPSFNAQLDALSYGTSTWVPSNYRSPTPPGSSTRTNTGFANNDDWSGMTMNSSVKSGLEGNLYGNVKPTASWVLHDGASDESDLPLVPLGFDMLSGDYGQSLFEAKYGGKADGPRGKEGSPLFGRVVGDRVFRENNIAPSISTKVHDAYPTTNHKEDGGINWNGLPFETRPLVWSSSADIKSPLINDGSRGKQDSAVPLGLFGDYVARENNIGPSIIGKSNGAFPAANNGLVSPSLSKEHSTTWNGNASYYETRPFFDDSSSTLKSISITKPSPSIVIKPSVTVSSFSAQGAVSTKSMDASSTSLFICNNVLDGDKPLKEQESGHPVGFKFKATSNGNNNTEDVKSASNLSEHLDNHQAEEDSPCWKGASTHFSLFGSLQAESSQHPINKVQENDSVNLQSNGGTVNQNMHISVEDAAKSVAAESLDVNHVLKALSSFSELLLSYCSEDESGLNKQDRKALDQIIGNLNVCMSGKIQQADAAQIVLEQNNDHVDKSIEQPPDDSVRDNDLPKDHNMIQTIKKVLDENLECSEDQSSDTMMYKNLWLEAEAELCVSSYRARFDRVKREMGKPKASVQDASDVASDIKKISTSIFSPIAPKVIHEAARSKTSAALANNPSFPNNVDHIVNDDVDNSVMARFNILKRREESNPVNMAEKEPGVDVEASINKTENSGLAEAPHLQHQSGEVDDEFPPASSTVREDIEHLVMARLNVLKLRSESDSVNFDHQVLADGTHAVASDLESQRCGLMAGPQFKHHAGTEKEMASDSVGGTSLMQSFDSGLYTTYDDAEKEVASGSVGGTNLMQNWFNPGLYSTYGASSDWEYVQKR